MFSTKLFRLAAVLAVAGALLAAPAARPTAAAPDSRLFPATGHTVSGTFLTYWDTHGGLAQQGYPLSEPFVETSLANGQAYTVQYFERAVFEEHPENAGTPYEVLLSPLGTLHYRTRDPQGAPGQQPAADGQAFPQTGHTVAGAFLAYWQSHGGVPQLGYPISDPFTEVSDLNGRPYTVQYFERAVLEFHPENAAPYTVLQAQLGRFALAARYPQGLAIGAGGVPARAPALPPPGPTSPPAPVPTGLPAPVPTSPPFSEYVATATVANPVPALHDPETVIGFLVRLGGPVIGAHMHTIWHFQAGDATCDAVTDTDGRASCGLNVGLQPLRVPVPIDVLFTTPGGVQVTTSTIFATQDIPPRNKPGYPGPGK